MSLREIRVAGSKKFFETLVGRFRKRSRDLRPSPQTGVRHHCFMIVVGLIFALFAPFQGPESTIRGLLDALNTKDESKIKSFAAASMGRQLKPSGWVSLLRPLVKNGAPFKLIKIADSSEALTRALVEDRNGERFAFSFRFAEGKIVGLLLGDPESLDEPPPKDYTGWKDLSSLVAAICKDTACPGMAVAIGRGQEPIEVFVSGVREIGKPTAVGVDEPWHIGSIGKSITATLIGLLVEEGKLKWETTLGDALPAVPMKDAYKSVTLLQIMRHRGGIPRDMNFTGERVDQIVGKESDPVAMRIRYAADILSRDPIGKPGEVFAYSNAGYALLGHIAETVTKTPFEELIQRRVFEPLGMKSAIASRKGLTSDRPSGHVKDKMADLKPELPDERLAAIIRPAGDIWMSMGDLVRFGRAHLSGLRGHDGLLTAKAIQVLHEGIPEGPGGQRYACGWTVAPLPGTALRHGHNGSNGTFRAELAIFPEQELVIAAVVNRGGESDPSPPLQAVLAIARRFAPAR